MPRPPAPGSLRLVQDFVNTLDVECGDDDLATVDALRDWLAARDLVPGHDVALTEADRETAVTAREALRALLRAHHGEPLDAEAVAVLNRLAEDAALVVRFTGDDDATLEPRGAGIRKALGQVFAQVVQAKEEGTWQRLKVCSEESCQWAFYDQSKNRSSNWCSMAVCGNRAKARAYRARRRG